MFCQGKKMHVIMSHFNAFSFQNQLSSNHRVPNYKFSPSYVIAELWSVKELKSFVVLAYTSQVGWLWCPTPSTTITITNNSYREYHKDIDKLGLRLGSFRL